MTSTPPPPGSSQRRQRRTGLIIGTVILALLAGLFVAHLTYSSTEQNQLSRVRRQLDHVPLPPGAVLADTTANEANGDAGAYLERRYDLPSKTPGAQIRATLAAAGFRLVALQAGGTAEPLSSTDWTTYASAASGDVYVRPPGTTSGGIEIRWNGNSLLISLGAGDLS